MGSRSTGARTVAGAKRAWLQEGWRGPTGGTAEQKDGLPATLCNAANSSRFWVVFIAIVSFVYAGLAILGGILLLIQGANHHLPPVVECGLLDLIFAVDVAAGGFLLSNYASRVGNLKYSSHAIVLEKAPGHFAHLLDLRQHQFNCLLSVLSVRSCLGDCRRCRFPLVAGPKASLSNKEFITIGRPSDKREHKRIMAGTLFDPYGEWLGINDPHRPPTNYQLLGLSPFESQHTVIEQQPQQQHAKLAALFKGEQRTLAKRIAFEVESAKTCLLNPATKASYDAGLRSRRAQSTPDNSQPLPRLRRSSPLCQRRRVPASVSSRPLLISRSPQRTTYCRHCRRSTIWGYQVLRPYQPVVGDICRASCGL